MSIPEEEVSQHDDEDIACGGDLSEIFEIRESPSISSALLSQAVIENADLDCNAHNISKHMPLKHSALLLYLSQNFFSSVVLDTEKQCDESHNLAFVRTFEEFVTSHAFHKSTGSTVNL